jgi:lipopolysaccharide biosynthesis glycosyltransferase
MRADVPLLCEDEYALYTDADVMFSGLPLELDDIKPAYLACTPCRKTFPGFNAGVIVMNIKALRDTQPEFIEAARITKEYVGVDELIYNRVYGDRYTPLPEEYNWKPYWGVNDGAKVIHFHGPKPWWTPDWAKGLEIDGFEEYSRRYMTILQGIKV